MGKKKLIIELLLLLCFFGIANFVEGQSTPKISESKTREKLNKRISMLISFQKEKNYGGLYEMLANEQRKGSGSKESFIKTYKTFDKKGSENLTNFSIKELGLFEPTNDFALVLGCGEYTKNKKKKYYESQVEAVYENNDWYFRSLIGASVGFGTEIKKCKMPKVKS